MKRMLSASFVSAIIALLCIMDAGVPIYGYQVILDPIRFTEMEMAGENMNMHIRNTNKRLAGPLSAPYLKLGPRQKYNAWAHSRKRRSPSALANPYAYAFANAYASPEPAPLPILKKYGYLGSPKGYTIYDDEEEMRQAGGSLYISQDESHNQ